MLIRNLSLFEHNNFFEIMSYHSYSIIIVVHRTTGFIKTNIFLTFKILVQDLIFAILWLIK